MKHICQSCSMPLKKDPKFITPTNENIKRANFIEYCSFCYENGEFKQPNITLQEMQKLVITKMRCLGIPTFLAWFFSRKLSKLKRWKG